MSESERGAALQRRFDDDDDEGYFSVRVDGLLERALARFPRKPPCSPPPRPTATGATPLADE